ncbi:MAG: hypothetical protein ACFFB2_10555 [Promethearchaeota archaeon]
MNIYRLISRLIPVVILLLFILPREIISVNEYDADNCIRIEGLTSRKFSAVHAVNIDIFEPTNTSTITNGTMILFRLTGSLDNKIFYRWSFDPTNTSFITLNEYFFINMSEILDYEAWISLFVYASVNSSEQGSEWISRHYNFYYDFKVPQFTPSISNNSNVYSFSLLSLNFSESVYNSKYRWLEFGSAYFDFPNDITSYDFYLDFPEGNYTLDLVLNDPIGNENHSILNYKILFTVQSDPENNSFIKGGSQITISLSDPYNVLYAWNDTGFSGVLDPAPPTEGDHFLHVKVEKSPGVWEIWNFTFTVDNTPIIILVNPSGGYVPPSTNLTITVDETPVTIWGIMAPFPLTINGTNPYWALLPDIYGIFNVTIYALDTAGNLASFSSLYEVSLSISWISPANNTIVNQDTSIYYYLNAEDWRTVLYNMDNTYNTTYLANIPSSSGIHSLRIYLEDNKRRWTSEYFQWWVKPLVTPFNAYNGSRIRSDLPINFSFGEIVPLVIYHWGNDSETSLPNVPSFITSLKDWSNKSALDTFLYIHVKGADDVWNNQTWHFIRDDSSISIDLYNTENNSVIHTPFQVHFSFNETPAELLYSWNGADNVSSFDTAMIVTLTLPQIIISNPQVVVLYVRDEVGNWNTQTYTFYTGTGIYELREENQSRIQGGNEVLVNLTLNPVQVGYQWFNHSDQSTLTTILWMIPAQYYSIPIPQVNSWSDLVLYYDLSDGIIINQTLMYFIDSDDPVILVLGTEFPYANVPLMNNGSILAISSTTKINISVNEDIALIKIQWNNNNLFFSQAGVINRSYLIDLEDLSTGLSHGNLTAFCTDLVGNNASYIWYFVFDNQPPVLLSINYADNSRIRPNSTLFLTFNESIHHYQASWALEGVRVINDSREINSAIITLFAPETDGSYSFFLTVYDASGNKRDLTYSYVVDGTPPQITVSLRNNSMQNSNTPLQLTISETISLNSFYQWNEENKTFFNVTSAQITLLPSEGQHVFTVYAEDLLGYNQSKRFLFIIDNTPIGRPRVSWPSGGFYSNDINYLRFYFDEKPVIVKSNWNNGTNQTLTIYSLPALKVGLASTTEEGNYYVVIDLPTAVFKTHKLILFIQDGAGNWAKYQFTYTKITSLTDLLPLFLGIVGILVIIVIYKREALLTKLGRKEEEKEEETDPSKPEKKIPVKKRQSGKMRKKGKNW